MQVVVSMYLATVAVVRIPVLVPHMDAEARLISSACSLMAASSCLLEFHEESFVLRGPGVRIHRRRREEIRERTGVALVGLVAPMQREPDLPHRLTVDLQLA